MGCLQHEEPNVRSLTRPTVDFIFMHLAALSKVWPGVGEGTAKNINIYNRTYYIENNGFGTLPNFKQQEKPVEDSSACLCEIL